MEALNYEFLIRRGYECGPDGLIGSSAETYRMFEKTITQLTDRTCNKTEEEKIHDYFSAFFLIKYFVGHALLEGIDKLKHAASPGEIEILIAGRSEVSEDAFLDKRRLDEVIRQANSIFRKNGLEVG